MPQQELCGGGNNYTKDSSNCSIFYDCVDLNTVLECSSGLAFDYSAQQCEWPSYVSGCEYLSISSDGVDFSGCNNETCLVPGECGFFYDCVTRTKQPCDHGLVFSYVDGYCTYPELVPGCENYTPAPTTPYPVTQRSCYHPKIRP